MVTFDEPDETSLPEEPGRSASSAEALFVLVVSDDDRVATEERSSVPRTEGVFIVKAGGT